MIVHEYLRIFVIMYKVVDYKYFMDDMEDYEIQTLSTMVNNVDYNDWRRMRILYYGIVSPYLKKPTTPEKLFPLPGDEDIEDHNIEMTNNERDALKIRAKRIQEKIFNKKVDG